MLGRRRVWRLALAHLLSVDSPGVVEAGDLRQPRRQQHHRPLADSVIFLFMEGGPSHLDLFDPKPKLSELAGQPLPSSFQPVITPMGEYDAAHHAFPPDLGALR